jgi:hypothetical protein
MATIQKRLQWIMRRGGLRLVDLQRWLQVPYPTVRSWVVGAVPKHYIALGLGLRHLENLVERGVFPLEEMPPRKRRLEIGRLRRKFGG